MLFIRFLHFYFYFWGFGLLLRSFSKHLLQWQCTFNTFIRNIENILQFLISTLPFPHKSIVWILLQILQKNQTYFYDALIILLCSKYNRSSNATIYNFSNNFKEIRASKKRLKLFVYLKQNKMALCCFRKHTPYWMMKNNEKISLIKQFYGNTGL